MASLCSSSQETATATPKTMLPTTKSEQKPNSSLTKAKKRKRDDIEAADEEDEIDVGDESTKTLELEASKYVPGLFLNLEWCKSVNYVELLEVFDNQGWTKLLGEHAIDDVYPKAIQEFCENYGYAKGTITSSVNGVDVSFNSDYLAKLFEVPNEGHDNYFKGKYNLKIGKVGKNEILTELGGKKGVNKIDHNSLSPLGKLLFNVVRRTVFPRTQKRNEASLLDCAVIYCLIFNVQVNFPSLMISHLDHTVPSGLKFGYGTLLTKILKSFEVPLDKYGKVGMKREQYIQVSTMNGLNLGVMGGHTLWYTEILRLEEENKRVEEEKSSMRKSRRLLAKTDSDATTIDLEEDNVKVREIEVLVPRRSEQLEQTLKELAEKQLDVEGQIFMMRQALSSFMLAFDKKHVEVLACLFELRDATGTQPKADGTTPQKPADTIEDGTHKDEPAAGTTDQKEEVPIASVPAETATAPVPLETLTAPAPTETPPTS